MVPVRGYRNQRLLSGLESVFCFVRRQRRCYTTSSPADLTRWVASSGRRPSISGSRAQNSTSSLGLFFGEHQQLVQGYHLSPEVVLFWWRGQVALRREFLYSDLSYLIVFLRYRCLMVRCHIPCVVHNGPRAVSEGSCTLGNINIDYCVFYKIYAQ